MTLNGIMAVILSFFDSQFGSCGSVIYYGNVCPSTCLCLSLHLSVTHVSHVQGCSQSKRSGGVPALRGGNGVSAGAVTPIAAGVEGRESRPLENYFFIFLVQTF